MKLLLLLASVGAAWAAPDPRIPEPLQPWEGWALWGQDTRDCPPPYNDAAKPLCLWPAQLALDVTPVGAKFSFSATVFRESWVPLPGGGDLWPQNVRASGVPVPVVERDGRPAVHLAAGAARIEGGFSWKKIPQKLSLPPSVGIVSLSIDGKPVENPAWNADGQLWLERNAASGTADKDFFSAKLFGVIEDGIPLWLRGEVELIVAGKSREEVLGGVVPEGWKLTSLESPLPVAVDDSGVMKAQVRPGKWTVKFSAFRLDNPAEFAFPKGVVPAAADELLAFRSRPDFRMVEIVGSPSVDVSQIAFPAQWRELPVYRWDTSAAFRLEERMRGMGLQRPAGLNISREWWLDESGKAFTFRDRLTGSMQEIWRLDAAEGQDLGSVRSNGTGQLITKSPLSGAAGVEIRSRDLNLEANGRMLRGASIPASGWQTDAEALRVTLNLPPGWRLFALFGADWVQGDWLTSWSLLDLFLLLIFSLAVGRLWGWQVAVLAFAAFALAYHEPGAPRYVWLWLLAPLALLRAIRSGWAHRVLLAAKWVVLLAFIFTVVPFASRQIQQAIYPQLERPTSGPAPGIVGQERSDVASAPATDSYQALNVISRSVAKSAPQQKAKDVSNLQYDTKARIQTGPGVPDWSWRTATFGWNGPVTGAQDVRPVMIPIGWERLLSVLRIALILALAALLLRRSRSALAALVAVLTFSSPCARAEFPDAQTLETLRARLLEAPDAFPNAAAIPQAALTLEGRQMQIDVQIDAAARCAVPLPGRFPAWSPVSVTLDGKQATALRRQDGYLWIPVSAGVHQVHVTGLLPDVSDWEWTFLLKPRTVTITSPEWTFSGVSPTGVPDQQVFFSKIQKSSPGEAAYDRQEFSSLAAVERRIELGLVWQVRTTVRRLSPGGKAIALQVPLLPGENVLSSNARIADGKIDVRLGAQQDAYSWESELTPEPELALVTSASDLWTESWHLVASPVWNVTISGLAPIFEPGNPDLIPVWNPWPGESVRLAISRPEPIPGATVTVEKAAREVSPGRRQVSSRLALSLRCSLGEDFPITLPANAEITALSINGAATPARIADGRLIVPLRPGDQSVQVDWTTDTPLGWRTTTSEVKLPVGSVNITTTLNVPESRWVIWTSGPLIGPAVRFWSVLACSLLAAWVLGSLPLSPLSKSAWMLLAIGLTQVSLASALVVIAWLFFIAWRGSPGFLGLPAWTVNGLQILLAGLTVIALSVFFAVVAEGLLGNPEMFIAGNSSTPSSLRWYQARGGETLPTPACFSVSIWWFRLLMLAWALWLAASLLRWLQLGWKNFGQGGYFRLAKRATPPPIP